MSKRRPGSRLPPFFQQGSVTETTARELRRFGIDASRDVAVTSQAEAEASAYYVCSAVGDFNPFRDCLRGTCAICEAAIFWRPHAPTRPRKICVRCFELITQAPRGD